MISPEWNFPIKYFREVVIFRRLSLFVAIPLSILPLSWGGEASCVLFRLQLITTVCSGLLCVLCWACRSCLMTAGFSLAQLPTSIDHFYLMLHCFGCLKITTCVNLYWIGPVFVLLLFGSKKKKFRFNMSMYESVIISNSENVL